jgi:S1-C subfamily serine protease
MPMSIRRAVALLAAVGLMGLPLGAQQPGGDDLNEQLEKSTKEAVRKVAPTIVQIQTSGGADMVAVGPKGLIFRKGLGPTTGVIVSPDGYIITSAFNFLNNPATIVVAVPGHKEPYVAKRVATDKSRMLTLIKIDAKDLPVPQAVPEKELRVGQWALALGRTLDLKRDQPPSVSMGILSALHRVWGKTIQTDAKVSPINYGGPLVDIKGRVQGILVPASPRGEEETAGFEWYDSGIGFAVPMHHVMEILPRLKEGRDLQKGVLGVELKSKDIYGERPEVSQVRPNTAAARAGIKPGDIILEIDGKEVFSEAQVKHLIGPKYEGDKLALKLKRGTEIVQLGSVDLIGAGTVLANAYLGILPMRDDPKLGLEVRHVYPKSPADKAGLKAGDRILKVGVGDKAPAVFTGQKRGRDELFDILAGVIPGTTLKLEVQRKGGAKAETLTVTLADMPGTSRTQDDTVPAKLPEKATVKKALTPPETSDPNVKPPKIDPPKKPETGLLKRTTASGEHKYWVYVPDDYDANVSYGVVLWLHPPDKHTDDDVTRTKETWEDFCKDHHLIVVGPLTEGESGWTPNDADWVLEALRDTLGRYSTDRQRVVAHGLGVGGQFAFYLGFTARDLIRGVATTGAVVNQPKDNIPAQRLSFYVVGGDRDPLIKAIAESRTRLVDRKLPVIYREIPNRGREYLDADTFRELVRWIDSLDRQ